MIKYLPKRLFNEIYSKVPRLCVEVVIKDKKGAVLTKREITPWKGFWHIPGGTILMGESIQSGIKRIALNETGLKVKIEKLLGIIEYPKKDGYGKPIGLAYLTTPIEGRLRGSDQGKEISFFKKSPKKMIKIQKLFLENNNIIK